MKKNLDITFLIEIANSIEQSLNRHRIPLDSPSLTLNIHNNASQDLLININIETNNESFDIEKFLCTNDECSSDYINEVRQFLKILTQFVPTYFSSIIACKELCSQDYIQFEEIKDVKHNETQSDVLIKTFEKIKQGIYEV